SDSRYVIDGLEKGWAKGWRARGWKNLTNPLLLIRISGPGCWILPKNIRFTISGSKAMPATPKMSAVIVSQWNKVKNTVEGKPDLPP
ncbi:ribonuclease H, partial [gut metagenome]